MDLQQLRDTEREQADAQSRDDAMMTRWPGCIRVRASSAAFSTRRSSPHFGAVLAGSEDHVRDCGAEDYFTSELLRTTVGSVYDGSALNSRDSSMSISFKHYLCGLLFLKKL